MIETLLLQNKNLILRVPALSGLASKFLLSRSPLEISDLQFETKYSNCYGLISEKNSPPFVKIMRRLQRYLGTGPIGPNKYWEYPWALVNLRLQKGMFVLDAGCGKSAVQFLLWDSGCKVVGIDAFENVEWHGIDRRLPKRFGCQIQYRTESIESISFPDNTFDRVCCISTIEHCRAKPVEDEKMTPQTEADHKLQRRLMNEMIRVLKPAGFLVVTVGFNIPRENCLLESNVDVVNLISTEGAELYGRRCPDLFPGEEGFDFHQVVRNSDIDITNYCDTLQTSVGFVLRKKHKLTLTAG